MTYIRKKSQKQERRTAVEFGGKTQIASGALWGSKGDVKSPIFLIENKFTESNYYTFSSSTWDKIFKEATKDGLRTPILQLDLQDISVCIINYSYGQQCILKKEVIMVSKLYEGKKSIRIKKEDLYSINNNFYVVIKFPSHELIIILLSEFLECINERN